MEKIINLTEEERQNLISQIWADKRGRIDGKVPIALYVSLDNPKPDFNQIREMMLEELLESPGISLDWAEDWGRVVICVAPRSELGCRLAYTKDEMNKRFIPVHTSRQLDINEMNTLIESLPEGSLGTILLNSQPTTIEGFLISYIHMLDQGIWELFLKDIPYRKALARVAEEGFTTKLATETEILLLKANDQGIAVRLYGSMVNKDVPKVMGVVILNKEVL